MSHSEFCRIRNFVALGIMSHSVLCRIRGYVVRYYVVPDYVAFSVMAFSIILHSALCRIRTNIVRRNVVRPSVGESFIQFFAAIAVLPRTILSLSFFYATTVATI